LIGVAVVLILIVAGGVGGFLLWNKSRSSTNGVGTANTNTTAPPLTPREVGRYWLKLDPAHGEPTQVAALVPIASGQSFKFHFTFDDDGYLYILGPGGDTNQPTAFLTNKPLAQTGVTSKKIAKGVEFSFPKDGKQANWLTLDKNPGTDNFIVIFSKTPLSSPSFLSEQVTGEPLPAAQQTELKSFITRYQDKRPVTELDESNAQAQFVRVKVTPDQTNNPIVFEIRIQHN